MGRLDQGEGLANPVLIESAHAIVHADRPFSILGGPYPQNIAGTAGARVDLRQWGA